MPYIALEQYNARGHYVIQCNIWHVARAPAITNLLPNDIKFSEFMSKFIPTTNEKVESFSCIYTQCIAKCI